jgi:hypothetical protein
MTVRRDRDVTDYEEGDEEVEVNPCLSAIGGLVGRGLFIFRDLKGRRSDPPS